MPFFETNDSVSIFYTTAGDASNPPILLIHGWCADSHDWSWQISLLSKNYYVIAFDLRGHGRSSAPEDVSYDVKTLIEDTAAVLRHLNILKNVIVIGHSMGGIVTSLFSILKPEFVKAIVFIDPPAWTSAAVAQATLEALPHVPDMTALALTIYGQLVQGAVPDWLKTWYFRRVEGMPVHVVRKTLEAFNSEGGLARKEEHVALVPKRKVPRLAVYIDQEKEELERGLGVGPLDEVTTIEGVGHWPHQVKSEEFNILLENWLKKIAS
ncbi:alpha/beta hydrolase fold protein [Dendryphion nanum]|uniref:Alpha/beta hydrolase fold protein n=1 Tax=Dendryphion nanum TaxID=256645 RepID=A0A9P9DD06_9PLEO|nr:alpha/beta hydrolase fold protein [Dendryphion nanum]